MSRIYVYMHARWFDIKLTLSFNVFVAGTFKLLSITEEVEKQYNYFKVCNRNIFIMISFLIKHDCVTLRTCNFNVSDINNNQTDLYISIAHLLYQYHAA